MKYVLAIAGVRVCAAIVLAAATATPAAARQHSLPPSPVRFLDVPYIQQSEALCGGAAAAMVMRYWGATGVYAETFAPLIDAAGRGIRAEDLLNDLRGRGWNVRSFRGDRALVLQRLADGQPVVALIEDRPGYFHFVVIVAWANERVVYHDPARAPFRVVREDVFDAAWAKADHWTMLALPPAEGIAKPSPGDERERSSTTAPCAELVAEGVRVAGTGRTAEALEIFDTAAGLCPAASAPLREAAGVFALDENWTEASRLAEEALSRDPTDEHAWRILATGQYVRGDSAAALASWNAVGEPVIDLVNVSGLDRTRYAAAAAALDVEPGTVLTTGRLTAANRRLSALPAAEAARVTYRPIGNGRANVEAVIVERPRFPTSRLEIASAAVSLTTDRTLSASAANITGAGDLLSLSWRWWERRPRIELRYEAPSRLGVWKVSGYGEEQSYRALGRDTIETRKGGSLRLSRWTDTLTRIEAAVGLDAWGSRGRTATLASSVEQRALNDRVGVRGTVSLLAGAFDTWTLRAAATARTRVRHEGTVLTAQGGFDYAAADAPLALWPGAGTGHAREALLRAHPLLDDGRVSGEVFGRQLLHGTAEVRRWTPPVRGILRLAPAVFVDVAAADERLRPGRAWHADAGAGLRIAIPGSRVLRVDLAKGLRDGSLALSIAWEK
ncbi:MAG TPA: C39 family peptidase [Vicinamibacterales bacterium]